MATITLQRALEEINSLSDEAFSITYLSYDKNRKDSRGREITLQNCVKSGSAHNAVKNQTIGLRPVGNSMHIHTAHIYSLMVYNGQMIIP